jgi:hypothetical protein
VCYETEGLLSLFDLKEPRKKWPASRLGRIKEAYEIPQPWQLFSS